MGFFSIVIECSAHAGLCSARRSRPPARAKATGQTFAVTLRSTPLGSQGAKHPDRWQVRKRQRDQARCAVGRIVSEFLTRDAKIMVAVRLDDVRIRAPRLR